MQWDVHRRQSHNAVFFGNWRARVAGSAHRVAGATHLAGGGRPEDRTRQPVIAQMDGEFSSAASAPGGSVVGGLISGIATWASQRVQARADQFAHLISLRERLYVDFIAAASKAYADAIVNDRPQIEDLAALQSIITRMRIISSP
ncbi:MAG: hypothetical protein ABSE20_24845 [Acetobacteraceae bacterium]|jgi:hypothetical protein